MTNRIDDIMFARSYGVELEVLKPASARAFPETADLLSANGIPCVVVGYAQAHQVHRTWKVTHDGTVQGVGMTGMEVVSPPLRGEEGLAEIRKVCDLLKNHGYRINKSCGLHVHVHVMDLTQNAKNRLAVDYARHEKLIDKLMPPSRRGARGGNGFCRTIARADVEALMVARDIGELANAVSGGTSRRSRSRWHAYSGAIKYVKLNYTSYHRYGTVEFRHHSGTVEADKATQWVRFCLRMVAKAALETPTTILRTVAQSVSRNRPVRAGSKLAIVRDLLLRAEGTTRAEAMAATGWPSISMQDNARQAGLQLRSVRGYGGTLRYFGTYAEGGEVATAQTPNVQTTARPTMEGFLASLHMPETDLQYWRRRQALFAPHAIGDDEEGQTPQVTAA